MSTTSWVEPGMRVAEYTTGTGTASARVATVERLTAKQIVLDNGNRYNRTTLRKVGESRESWTYSTTLERLTAECVVAARRAAIVRIAQQQIAMPNHLEGEDALRKIIQLAEEGLRRLEKLERESDGSA